MTDYRQKPNESIAAYMRRMMKGGGKDDNGKSEKSEHESKQVEREEVSGANQDHITPVLRTPNDTIAAQYAADRERAKRRR